MKSESNKFPYLKFKSNYERVNPRSKMWATLHSPFLIEFYSICPTIHLSEVQISPLKGESKRWRVNHPSKGRSTLLLSFLDSHIENVHPFEELLIVLKMVNSLAFTLFHSFKVNKGWIEWIAFRRVNKGPITSM